MASESKKYRKRDRLSSSRIYHVWYSMLKRCEDPNHVAFESYGGRGIAVCPAWHDFFTFRQWAIETGYDENAARGECTLDRIDNDMGYSPDNCRWVSMKEQYRNRRVPQYHGGSRRPVQTWDELVALFDSVPWTY